MCTRLDMQEMDVTAMEYENNTFDVVIDKSTLDALACTTGGAAAVMRDMVLEIYRVLKPGGVYICVSFGTPNVRWPVFNGCEPCC